ncbi:MAG: sigma-70 family RNA polymerase sigma factor [Culicoidibacterales bacterium]
MTQTNYLLDLIAPKVYGKQMTYDDFEALFASYKKEQQYELLAKIEQAGIELVDTITYLEPVAHETFKPKTVTNELLCYYYQQGNQAALETLIQQNKPFLWKRANQLAKMYNHKIDIEDLVQQGSIGIMIAANKFDVTVETKFITYAANWVFQSMTRHIADCGFTVRLPQHYFDQMMKLMKLKKMQPLATAQQLYQLLAADLGSHFTFEAYQLLEKNTLNYLNIASLDVAVSEEGTSTVCDFIACEQQHTNPVVQAEAMELTTIIQQILADLPVREQQVIVYRFGLFGNNERTLEEIGQIFKVTRERIRQIEAKALRKLRAKKCYLYDFASEM